MSFWELLAMAIGFGLIGGIIDIWIHPEKWEEAKQKASRPKRRRRSSGNVRVLPWFNANRRRQKKWDDYFKRYE